MRAFSWLSMLCAAGLFGCASDESVVCDRLAECDIMPVGLSAQECEDQAARQVPEDRLERCAACMEDHDCAELPGACRDLCEPGD
jgi:hypothetical protein